MKTRYVCIYRGLCFTVSTWNVGMQKLTKRDKKCFIEVTQKPKLIYTTGPAIQIEPILTHSIAITILQISVPD